MNKPFVQGMKDGFPIFLGYLSVSIAFGMSCIIMGIPTLEAVLISATNLTSAGQVAGSALIAAGASLTELLLTTLVINARYFLMSLSLSQKLDSSMTWWKRMLVAYGITDEIFAVEISQKHLSFPYMMGLILVSAVGWISGTFIGATAGELLPASIAGALNIALYAMFIAIVLPPARTDQGVLLCAVISVILSCLFSVLPGFREISSGYAIIIVTLIVSAFCAWKAPRKNEEEELEEEAREREEELL